jgi:hypothetical protein
MSKLLKSIKDLGDKFEMTNKSFNTVHSSYDSNEAFRGEVD